MAHEPYSINPSALSQLESASIDPNNPIGFIRTSAGYVADWATNIPALPTSVYALASDLLKVSTEASVFKEDDSITTKMARNALNILTPVGALRHIFGAGAELPGAQDAREITEAIEKTGLEWGSAVAGRRLDPGILGDNSYADKFGTVAKAVGGLIPITGGWIKTAFEGIKQVNTGIKALDKITPVALETIKWALPFVPTNSPKTVMGVSTALGVGPILAGELIDKNKEQKSINDFVANLTEITGEVNNIIVRNADTAIIGAAQAADTNNKLNTAQATEQVKSSLGSIESAEQFAAGLKPIEFAAGLKPIESAEQFAASLKPIDAPAPAASTDIATKALDFLSEHTWAAAVVSGVALAAGVASHKNNAISQTLAKMVGGRKKFEDINKVGGDVDAFSDMSAATVANAQAVNWARPITHYSPTADTKKVLEGKADEIAAATLAGIETVRSTGKFSANSNVALSGGRTLADVEQMFKLADSATVQEAGAVMNAETEVLNRRRRWLDPESGIASSALRKAGIDNPTVDAGYRNWLATEKAAPNAVVADVERKMSFHQSNTSYDDLMAVVTAGRNNPAVSQLVEAYGDVTRKTIDWRREQGLMSKADYAQQLRAHPRYYPVRTEGSHLTATKLTEAGGRLVQGNPITELHPYLSEVFKSVAHEKLVAASIGEQIALRAQGDVRASKLLGKHVQTESINDYNKDKIVSYRDDNGVRKNIIVNDPIYRDALMPGASNALIRMNTGLMRVLAAPSRVTEEFSTGKSSALVGSPFALGHFMYTAGSVLGNRPAGTVSGWGDALTQSLGITLGGILKHPIGFRGDLSFYAQSGIQAINNVVARMAQHGALAIENSMGLAWNAPAMGNGARKTVGKFMANHWKASMLHEMEKYGLSHGAGPMIQETSMSMAELERGLSASTLASGAYRSTRNFVQDILGAVGNAPLTSYYKQNKGRMSQDELVHAARNVTGNPSRAGLGTSGFGSVAVGATNLSPWGTVTVQSLARFAKAATENPLGTTAAIVNSVAIPSMMATYWTIAAGKEYLEYQHKGRTPEQIASSIYFPIPGRRPEEGLEWRIDQILRPFKIITDIIHGHAYGLFDVSIFNERNNDLRRALVDSIGTRYGITGDVMKAGFAQIIPAVVTGHNLAAGLMGSDQMARSYIDPSSRAASNRSPGATDSTSKITDNNFFGYPISAKFEATISATMGQVGTAILDTVRGVTRGKEEGLTRSEVISDMGTRAAINFGKSTREVSGLWHHAATLAPSQTADAKALRPQIESMKALADAHNTLNKGGGTGDYAIGSKQRGWEALLGAGKTPFKDLEMSRLGFAAHNFMTLYNRQYSGQLTTLYDQRASLLGSEKLSPTSKHNAMNLITKEITEVNKEALSAMNQWKWRMSTLFNKDIDLYNIKLGEPITQFKKLLPDP